MGNYSFLSFRRAISDIQFESMVKEIVQKQFPTHEIRTKTSEDLAFWEIKPRSGYRSIFVGNIVPRMFTVLIFRESKGKFCSKLGGNWNCWLMGTVFDYVAYNYNGLLFDEGSWPEKRYKPEQPIKYKTFRKYMENLHKWTLKSNPELFEKIWNSFPEVFRY